MIPSGRSRKLKLSTWALLLNKLIEVLPALALPLNKPFRHPRRENYSPQQPETEVF
jgi:hypothetical protein